MAARGATKAEPEPADQTTALARDARSRGQAALAGGDSAAAARWLDRACRLAPDDRSLALALAVACLATDPRRAATLFARIGEQDDVREAWLGLSAALLRLDDISGAASTLIRALQRHTPAPPLLAGSSIADEVARAAHAAGWCALRGDGSLVIRTRQDGKAAVQLDGRICRNARLPRGWEQGDRLSVRLAGRDLLGSPIDIAAIRRCAGFVQAEAGGLRGWAWHPGDPDTAPVLTIRPARGGDSLTVVADQPVDTPDWTGALARPRGFSVPAAAVATLSGPLHVLGPDGRELTGSPLPVRLEALAPETPPAPRIARSKRPVSAVRPTAVVIPVFNNAAAVAACLDSVLDSVPPDSPILLIDDASTDPEIAPLLARYASTGRVTVLRQARNAGFPAAANAGIAACPEHDVVLLNSDTLLPPGWLQRLRDAAYSAADIGSATPLSNNASVLSYPDAADRNPEPTLAETVALDRLAQAANDGTVVEIPVGVGFCLYLRRDCLAETGALRADIFAQGYGEENDFCLRARQSGWRHVAAPNVFVGHAGGGSFGLAGRHLQRRNQALLAQLHPGYAALVQEFLARDPLAEARRRLDLQRWRQDRARQAAILITHDAGGGVERQIAAAAAAHRAAGRRPIVLRPAQFADGTRVVQLEDVDGEAFPNLRYRLPEELPDLLRLLRADRPKQVEIHHLVGHPPAIYDLVAQLRLPYSVHVHDYAWFCPRISLVGGNRRYCGEPSIAGCEACIAEHGALNEETITVDALRDRSSRLLTAAARVVAPSGDTATRMRRHFPNLRVDVAPHEDDAALPPCPAPSPRDGCCRVCVLGAIGLHKGYDVLLACALDAAQRQLPLEFVVVGHTIDDARLLDTGSVFVTGRYQPHEAVALVAAQNASIGFLPSIWPETWSLGLTELWRAGLRVAAFDFGAPAERIRRTGRGLILPIGLQSRAINNALVAATGLTVHEGA